MKKKLTVSQICSVVCAVLLLALVVCQFMPFWTAEEESVSIQKCVWFPQECKDITKMLDKTVEAEINDIYEKILFSFLPSGVYVRDNSRPNIEKFDSNGRFTVMIPVELK